MQPSTSAESITQKVSITPVDISAPQGTHFYGDTSSHRSS